MPPRAPFGDSAFDLIVDGLAVSRVARLVVDDEITRPAREAIAKKWPDSPVVTLIGCRACVSVWTAGLLVSGILPQKLRLLLALSEVAVIIERVADQRGQVDSGWD